MTKQGQLWLPAQGWALWEYRGLSPCSHFPDFPHARTAANLCYMGYGWRRCQATSLPASKPPEI